MHDLPAPPPLTLYSPLCSLTSFSTWIEATPIPNTFVINLGDALEHNTGGLLLATPHRVAKRQGATTSRYSFPFFYDPSFTAEMQSVASHLSEEDRALAASHILERERNSGSDGGRWDRQAPAMFKGTYGGYLLKKVAKVFPLLAEELLL